MRLRLARGLTLLVWAAALALFARADHIGSFDSPCLGDGYRLPGGGRQRRFECCRGGL